MTAVESASTRSRSAPISVTPAASSRRPASPAHSQPASTRSSPVQPSPWPLSNPSPVSGPRPRMPTPTPSPSSSASPAVRSTASNVSRPVYRHCPVSAPLRPTRPKGSSLSQGVVRGGGCCLRRCCGDAAPPRLASGSAAPSLTPTPLKGAFTVAPRAHVRAPAAAASRRSRHRAPPYGSAPALGPVAGTLAPVGLDGLRSPPATTP